MAELKHLAVLKSAVEASRGGLIDTVCQPMKPEGARLAVKVWITAGSMTWAHQALQDLWFSVLGRVIKADKKCFRSKEAQKTGERHIACVCKRAAAKLEKNAPVCLCVRNHFAVAPWSSAEDHVQEERQAKRINELSSEPKKTATSSALSVTCLC